MTQPPDASNSEFDDIDRRGFLRCMAWAGTGLVWGLKGGVLRSTPPGSALADGTDLFFVQISDSHIGFDKAANTDVTATMRAAIAKIDGLPTAPAFLIHTGDISQLAKPSEFDTADQLLRESRTKDVFFVPGEHDVGSDGAASYLARYGGRGKSTGGWYSFDHSGVHFIGLVNVLDLKAGGLGSLGSSQLEWLDKDVKQLSASTPIVVFAHVPLWSVYPEWGWGTDDGAKALGYLRRFGSVTVLNGHIHQTMQKVEGHVTFHTAMSTAFPQPRPGTAPAPGPLVVAPGLLKDVLGITHVHFATKSHSLALVDDTLSGGSPAAALAAAEEAARGSARGNAVSKTAPGTIRIDNFAFTPRSIDVAVGQQVTWINGDDTAHRIVSSDAAFAPSAVLDTKATFVATFHKPGRYAYFCGLHPTMTGSIIVR